MGEPIDIDAEEANIALLGDVYRAGPKLVGALCAALRERDAEIARLRELVADVAHCGVESDLSPRYVVVQIDCETWADVQREAQP